MNYSSILLIIIGGYALYYSAMVVYDLFIKKEVAMADHVQQDEEIDVRGIVNSVEFAPREIRKTDVVMDDPILTASTDEEDEETDNNGMGDGILNCSDGMSVEEFMAAIKQDSDGNPFANIEFMAQGTLEENVA